MALQLNLEKSVEKLRLNLSKAGMVIPPVVEVCFNLDVSGSYRTEHERGDTNTLTMRLIPWGLVFDPDKKLDVFTFSDGPENAHYVGAVNEGNYTDFVKSKIIRRVPGWGGGTTYSHVLQKNLELFGWETGEKFYSLRSAAEGWADIWNTTLNILKGWVNSPKEMLTAKNETASESRRKSLILFNTDGANDDEEETNRIFQRMEKEKYGVYVIFLAYSKGGNAQFSSLKKLTAEYANVDLCIIRDMDEWVKQDDEAINKLLITPRLIKWLNA